MRLTLRNLLAYLHQVMSPEDQTAFEELIKASPQVGKLIERCRELAKRAELGAPALDDASREQAAESVAMYLDFTYPDGQLAAFEKLALASDEQLAEIVQCHRVLADLVRQEQSETLPAWRERIVALTHQHEPAAVGAGVEAVASPAQETASAGSDAMAEQRVVHTSAHDSGALSDYLGSDDDDDDDELSLEAVREREKRAEKQAIAAAASAYTTAAAGTATANPPAPRIINYGVRDPFKQQTKIPDALIEKKEPSKVPMVMVGGVGAGVVLVGLVVWLTLSGLSSGPNEARATGPHVYGIGASEGMPTCELTGTITVSMGGALVPDAGAIIVTWPVDAPQATKLSAVQVMNDLSAQRQNPYNLNLVVAKTDENGHYHMRMTDHAEFHVMILSERVQSPNAKIWGDAVETLKSQVEDPPTLIGSRVYHFTQLSMPPEKRTTLDHTFEPQP